MPDRGRYGKENTMNRSTYHDHYRAALVALWAGNARGYRRMVSAIAADNLIRADRLLTELEG